MCIHSRILVREPWERSSNAHIGCESINPSMYMRLKYIGRGLNFQ